MWVQWTLRFCYTTRRDGLTKYFSQSRNIISVLCASRRMRKVKMMWSWSKRNILYSVMAANVDLALPEGSERSVCRQTRRECSKHLGAIPLDASLFMAYLYLENVALIHNARRISAMIDERELSAQTFRASSHFPRSPERNFSYLLNNVLRTLKARTSIHTRDYKSIMIVSASHAVWTIFILRELLTLTTRASTVTNNNSKRKVATNKLFYTTSFYDAVTTKTTSSAQNLSILLLLDIFLMLSLLCDKLVSNFIITKFSYLRGYPTLWKKNGVSFPTLNYFWVLSFEKIAKSFSPPPPPCYLLVSDSEGPKPKRNEKNSCGFCHRNLYCAV